MDFSFKFLEMFEDRFGRRATNVLLALIGLAVAALCTSSIIQFIIKTFSVVSKVMAANKFTAIVSVLTPKFALYTLVTAIVDIAIGLAVFYFIFVPFFYDPKDRIIKNAVDKVSKMIENLTKLRDEAVQARTEAASILADITEKYPGVTSLPIESLASPAQPAQPEET